MTQSPKPKKPVQQQIAESQLAKRSRKTAAKASPVRLAWVAPPEEPGYAPAGTTQGMLQRIYRELLEANASLSAIQNGEPLKDLEAEVEEIRNQLTDLQGAIEALSQSSD